ncbi:MAG: SseB family protein [Gammaproteobacteria bacterium]|nr:SseB family protein [Gammaproteobacteria bacterium]
MTELDQVISLAYASEGKQDDVNKVYLTLLRSLLYVPVEKMQPLVEEQSDLEVEPFKPLFAKIEKNFFMLAFDTLDRLKTWAGSELEQIDYVEIGGRDVIAGISDQVFLCLNLGLPFYKEFSPEEIKHLKTIVARIDQLRGEV